MEDEKEPKAEAGMESKMPGAEGAEGASPGGPKGGLGDFLFEFLKANPDLAREMSTRMNAVLNGQRLQGLKGTAPGGAPGKPAGGIPVTNPGQMGIRGEAPPAGGAPAMQQMAGDVLPMPGDRSMGPGETAAAVPFATGQQQAPNVQSIGQPTLQQWLANVKARQG